MSIVASRPIAVQKATHDPRANGRQRAAAPAGGDGVVGWLGPFLPVLAGAMASFAAAFVWGEGVAEWLAVVTVGLSAALFGQQLRLKSQHRRQQEKLREQLAQAAASCLFTWTPADGTMWLSSRWQTDFKLRPTPPESALARWLDKVHPEDVERVRRVFQSIERGDRHDIALTHRLSTPDGWRFVKVRATAAADSSPAVWVGSALDITEQERSESKLAYGAFHDTLTGLANRALFMDRLAHCLARARRNPRYRFAVLFLDIDEFKVINDSLGHASGDALLVELAERLRTSVRPGDTVARLGGDEFTVLLDPVKDAAQADDIAKRLGASISGSVSIGGHKVQTSASIGVACSSPRYSNPDDLVRDADTAMYRAKQAGKGTLRQFDQTMHDSAMRRLQLESLLHRAAEAHLFVVHYQPIISLDDGKIRGFEALVRLPDETGRLVSPGEFIPVAEQSGLIDTILDEVLDQAALQLTRWVERYPDLYVSVNASARSARPDLIQRIAGVLRRTGLAPKNLKLELTESVLVSSAGTVAKVLEAIRELGVGLYIDDFGTGYSSLSYMHRFPVECLKIDRSFVSALEGTRMPRIVETIIDLSRRLNAQVVAEGIETEAQFEALRGLGCHYGQGYLFAAPMPVDEATQLLESGRSW